MLLINNEFLFARLFRLISSSLIHSLKIQVFFHEIFPD